MERIIYYHSATSVLLQAGPREWTCSIEAMLRAMASLPPFSIASPNLRKSLCVFSLSNVLYPLKSVYSSRFFSVSSTLRQVPSSPLSGFDIQPYLSCSMPEKQLKVAVLLSGGVDSSVALRLLHAAGHSCTAYYFKIWFQVKDQMYFLSHLSQDQLKHLFPLGCIPKVKFSEFVAKHIGESEGVLLEAETGDFLGKHRCFWFHNNWLTTGYPNFHVYKRYCVIL
ncbi:hypothetical protein H6P81_009418 [Aristolochia fimbriata]|uniref:Uncharacterized protein n=1 Tax=Aristolochia fimbriata TaxID=158543 RepID=A0AAV7EKW3_ARIFI|nr:hypothetical protein H6P81_009418 [Aristolochia fimbriata]